MNQYFLVIYMHSIKYDDANLAKTFEDTHKLTDNVFVCKKVSPSTVACETVRSELMEGNDYKMMIVKLDSDFSSAWYLNQTSSDYLKAVFNEIHHGEKQDEK